MQFNAGQVNLFDLRSQHESQVFSSGGAGFCPVAFNPLHGDILAVGSGSSVFTLDLRSTICLLFPGSVEKKFNMFIVPFAKVPENRAYYKHSGHRGRISVHRTAASRVMFSFHRLASRNFLSTTWAEMFFSMTQWEMMFDG